MISKINKLLDKIGIYILALGTVTLNISLAFDNVVWGDEAYSQMAVINCSYYGVFERIYYWDSHPPLYYYYLRVFADIFGYNTPVYHFASLVPFIVGIALACTLMKKHLGTLPAMVFIIVSGLSASCSEYNLEIRMYSLAFMFVLLCTYCSYLIIKDNGKTVHFVWMTVFGVCAAYTHYYGLAICGLIVFLTGLWNVLHERNSKNILKCILSTVIYIVVYIPWLFVLYFQTQAELGNAWMTEPDPFNKVLKFISGGDRLYPIVFSFAVIMTVIMLVNESGLMTFKKGSEKASVTITLHKPTVRGWSVELRSMLLFWAVELLLLGFGYGVSFAFHPILTYRYTYVMIPVLLFIVMLGMKKLIEYGITDKAKYGIVWAVLAACLLVSLFDFKYYRSVVKTQEVETQKILNMIGTPADDTVLVANGVKHLAWTVLQYYYPNNEITMDAPNKLGKEPEEIWAFVGYVYDDETLEDMENMGYSMEAGMNMWLGKYGVNMYHFYK